MPVEYSGIADEHMAVRTRAGLFDVSHMGQVASPAPRVQGGPAHHLERCEPAVDRPGALLGAHHAAGHIRRRRADVRLADNHFMMVVNASNIPKDVAWITANIAGIGDAVAVNASSRYALIALQGPAARDVLQTLTGVNLADIKYLWFTTGEVAGVRVTISRTGYTARMGSKSLRRRHRPTVCRTSILEAGKSAGVVPAGLGARDTLRLEAAMRLYGNDIDETTSVLEADLR